MAKIVVDPCGDACAASEGATLSLFSYQDLKSKKKEVPKIQCLDGNDSRFEITFFCPWLIKKIYLEFKMSVAMVITISVGPRVVI